MAVGNSAMSLERVKERRRSVCVMMYWREGEIGVRRQVPDAAWLGIARLLCHLRCTRPSGMPVLDSADLSVTAWLRNTTLSKINLFPKSLPRLLSIRYCAAASSSRLEPALSTIDTLARQSRPRHQQALAWPRQHAYAHYF
jgi:hypothetical protein